MDKKFLKVGKNVSFKFNTDGLECNLTPGMVYNIKVDSYTRVVSLEETTPFVMPSKVYCTSRDKRFIDKVLNSYKLSENGFTGVMLSGLKGSGKTIMAKSIANESNLPIINIDKSVRPWALKVLVELLGDPNICFMFDELDKLLEDYDDSALLQILDGADTKGQHMILFTCNNEAYISEYLIDRCSRIRYWRKFGEISPSLIMEMLNDKLNDKKEVESLTDFIKDNFEICSFDNIASFINEVNNYPTATFEELFEDMNLTPKNGQIKPAKRSSRFIKSNKKRSESYDDCCDCCC